MASQFVAGTDEVWRLQRGSDPECKFFQEMADHGHYGGRPGSTRQGIYVCAPSGKFLASINSNSPDRVLATMQKGLEAWKALNLADRRLADDAAIKPEHRWEASYPEGGLVLNMFTRDLPRQDEVDAKPSTRWNQDRVWYSKDEARSWLPEEIAAGVSHALPETTLSRLTRFHLVDTVHGQTSTFSSRHIKNARITVTVAAVSDSRVKVEIVGNTHAESTRRSRSTVPHGVKTELLGHAVFDLDQKKFVKFDLVALGTRWGYTTNNGRRRQPAESPVGFVFQLASAEEPRIAPAFIGAYDASWVTRPRGFRSFDPVAIFTRQDANGDGVLQGDEISERLRDRLNEIDSSSDGVVTKEEFVEGLRRIFRRGSGR